MLRPLQMTSTSAVLSWLSLISQQHRQLPTLTFSYNNKTTRTVTVLQYSLPAIKHWARPDEVILPAFTLFVSIDADTAVTHVTPPLPPQRLEANLKPHTDYATVVGSSVKKSTAGVIMALQQQNYRMSLSKGLMLMLTSCERSAQEVQVDEP